VLGEIACGNLRNRGALLELPGNLPSAPVATNSEVLAFMEQRQFMGRGLGYVDVHLLAATALATDLRLWTRDKRLSAVARQQGLGA
jgi:predicted nucleic acid-binding protein